MSNKKPLSQLWGREYYKRLREVKKENEEFAKKNPVEYQEQKERLDKVQANKKWIDKLTEEIIALVVLFFGLKLVDWLFSFKNLFADIVALILCVFLIAWCFLIMSLFIETKDTFDYSYSRPRKRKPIKPEIKNQVWNRDGGRCVRCGTNQKLEFDHIIPHSKGGADTYRNLQLLCESCNRSKGASI